MHALAAGSGSDPASAAAAIAIFAVIFVAYWVPTIVALCRKGLTNTGSIVVINVFLGWTLVGWVVALAMACRSAPRPVMVFPPPYGPPPQLPPPGRGR